MASEVAPHAFVGKLGAESFSSSTAFDKTFNEYMKDNYVIFVRSSSNRSTNAVLRYEWVYHKCRKRPARQRLVNLYYRQGGSSIARHSRLEQSAKYHIKEEMHWT
ncbi:hypothetical protein CLF_109702 [Clonorchis sinensis]|uniref:Uncharacterized protein n=1 Tax=Clonorchis sinensis TaxID=79923 RepID=G7YJP0_CLOSI|nr:hypothetical protein CLF_109702 [Clonorchis sinensis]